MDQINSFDIKAIRKSYNNGIQESQRKQFKDNMAKSEVCEKLKHKILSKCNIDENENICKDLEESIDSILEYGERICEKDVGKDGNSKFEKLKNMFKQDISELKSKYGKLKDDMAFIEAGCIPEEFTWKEALKITKECEKAFNNIFKDELKDSISYLINRGFKKCLEKISIIKQNYYNDTEMDSIVKKVEEDSAMIAKDIMESKMLDHLEESINRNKAISYIRDIDQNIIKLYQLQTEKSLTEDQAFYDNLTFMDTFATNDINTSYSSHDQSKMDFQYQQSEQTYMNFQYEPSEQTYMNFQYQQSGQEGTSSEETKERRIRVLNSLALGISKSIHLPEVTKVMNALQSERTQHRRGNSPEYLQNLIELKTALSTLRTQIVSQSNPDWPDATISTLASIEELFTKQPALSQISNVGPFYQKIMEVLQ